MGSSHPLLANIALSVLDEHFTAKWEALGKRSTRGNRRRAGVPVMRLVRYADDFVVMVAGTRHDAEALRDEVAAVFAPMGLRLSEEKTRVCHIDDGFDFLGWRIQRRTRRGRSGKRAVYTYPSKKALASIVDKVRSLTRRGRHRTLAVLLRRLNPVLRGWCNYFRHGVSQRTFSYVDYFAFWRVFGWLRKRHVGLSKHTMVRRHLPGWKISDDGIDLFRPEAVAIVRYRYRGSNIPTHGRPRRQDQRHPRHEHVESRMRWKSHVRFGGRGGETHLAKAGQGAPLRPLHTVTRYRCVDDQKAAGFPVTAACEAAGVSTSGFYDWHAREAAGPTERQVAEAELVELIREIFDASNSNYGVPRMRRELRRGGVSVNEKRVRRLMRLHGMTGRCRRRRCQTTFPGPDGYVIPDLIGRRFEPGAPNVAWVQDITYIHRDRRRLAVPGLGARSRLAPDARLLDGRPHAHRTRPRRPRHGRRRPRWRRRRGDRPRRPRLAAQYTSNDYLNSATPTRSAPPSVAPVCAGTTPWPNRSGNHSSANASKNHVFATRAAARRAIFRWINWYNTTRLHTSLNSIPPIEWEQQYRQAS